MGALRYIAATTVLLAGVTPASAVHVGSIPAVSGGVVETRFVANPELGRAWIEVTVHDSRHRDESSLTQVVHHSRFQVPGLSFDAATSRIVFHTGKERVECAKVETGKPLFNRPPAVRATGKCAIATETATVARDDGFHMHSREQLQLRLQVADAKEG